MRLVGVRFKRACKVYDFDAGDIDLKKGEMVIVETERGMDIGWVVYGPREEKGPKNRQIKRVIRKATEEDLERMESKKEWEEKAFSTCLKKIEKLRVPMKLVRAEYLFDRSKVIFYFTAEGRVDFRALVRELASALHTRIEMRQIGVRDEAKMVGGIGPCGMELCCSRFLVDFEPVTVKMARDQNLAINPSKLSGLCGRLMCCLAFEQQKDRSNCLGNCHSN